jgi:FkbM family methyltransferase
MRWTFKTEFDQIPQYIYWELYTKIYKNCKEKIFVDVGAYDGITHSNTYRLYRTENWFGIYCEPNPYSVKKLISNCVRKTRYALNECAVGEYNGYITLYLNEEYSSVNESSKNSIIVPIKTLDDILSETIKYNLLSIDVEGYEDKVLQKYDISKHNPEICIIETHDKNPNFDKTIASYCNRYFDSYGYKKYFSNHINSIYVHSSCYDRLKIFSQERY